MMEDRLLDEYKNHSNQILKFIPFLSHKSILPIIYYQHNFMK